MARARATSGRNYFVIGTADSGDACLFFPESVTVSNVHWTAGDSVKLTALPTLVPGTSFTQTRRWKATCRAEGCSELRLYDLRHCYGQWLSEAGAPEAHIQVGLRHKSPLMTRRYTKQRDRGENARVLASVLFPKTGSRRNSRHAADAGRRGTS